MAIRQVNAFVAKRGVHHRDEQNVSSERLNEVLAAPLVNTSFVEQYLPEAEWVNVRHQLGRKPLGYIIVKRDAATIVIDDQTREHNPLTEMPLQAGVNLNASIIFF